MKRNVIVLIILAVFATSSFLLFNKARTNKAQEKALLSEPKKITTTIIVDDGKEKTEVKTTSNEIKTAYDLLLFYAKEKNVEVKTKQYDFGLFVESIKGMKSGAAMSWIYYINDKSAEVGADKYNLNDGDTILWKYEKPKY